jgi:hypothetical protein
LIEPAPLNRRGGFFEANARAKLRNFSHKRAGKIKEFSLQMRKYFFSSLFAENRWHKIR